MAYFIICIFGIVNRKKKLDFTLQLSNARTLG